MIEFAYIMGMLGVNRTFVATRACFSIFSGISGIILL